VSSIDHSPVGQIWYIFFFILSINIGMYYFFKKEIFLFLFMSLYVILSRKLPKSIFLLLRYCHPQ